MGLNYITISDSLTIEGKRKFADYILKSISDVGLGSYSKSEFEAYLFHCLTLSIDKKAIKDNYDWMRLLKVTPSKLRSLQMIRSAKFKSLDFNDQDNWSSFLNLLSEKKIEIEDKKKGTVRFYIDDVHIQRFIEKYIVNAGSSLDYTINRNQIVLKYDLFKTLLNELISKSNNTEEEVVKELKEDNSVKQINSEFTSLDAYLTTLKTKLAEEGPVDLVKGVFTTSMDLIIKYLAKKVTE